MSSHSVKGILSYPDGEDEKLEIEMKKHDMEEIKNAVKTIQSDCNLILTEKIAAEKLKEPAEKKPRKADIS